MSIPSKKTCVTVVNALEMPYLVLIKRPGMAYLFLNLDEPEVMLRMSQMKADPLLFS